MMLSIEHHKKILRNWKKNLDEKDAEIDRLIEENLKQKEMYRFRQHQVVVATMQKKKEFDPDKFLKNRRKTWPLLHEHANTEE